MTLTTCESVIVCELWTEPGLLFAPVSGLYAKLSKPYPNVIPARK